MSNKHTKTPIAYFIPIDGVMVRHALIQQKHFDKVVKVMRSVLDGGWVLSVHDINRIKRALKNIN